MDYQLSKIELRDTKTSRKDFKQLEKYQIVCILDNLSNIYNIGVIIRLCEAFRIEKLYLCGDAPDLTNGKLKNTAVGSQNWLDIEYRKDIVEVIKNLQKQNYVVSAVELTKNAQHYDETENIDKIAYIFGNENFGISDEVINCCNNSVYIPMYGMGNSLNVSTAASIIIAHAVLKLHLK